jgi:hypothetical protein
VEKKVERVGGVGGLEELVYRATLQNPTLEVEGSGGQWQPYLSALI